MSRFLVAFFLTIISSVFSECTHWEKECLVNIQNPRNHFAYIFVPKNGCTFLRRVLSTYEQIDYDEKFKDHYKVFVIRDPLYRPISIYSEVMKRRYKGWETAKQEFYKNRENLVGSFIQFLDRIENDFYEPHVSLQHWYLDAKSLTLDDMDFIFLFEEFEKDLKLFCQMHQLRYNHEPLNVSSEEVKETLKKLIDTNPAVQRKIRKIWEADFALYEEAKNQRQRILSHLD